MWPIKARDAKNEYSHVGDPTFTLYDSGASESIDMPQLKFAYESVRDQYQEITNGSGNTVEARTVDLDSGYKAVYVAMVLESG